MKYKKGVFCKAIDMDIVERDIESLVKKIIKYHTPKSELHWRALEAMLCGYVSMILNETQLRSEIAVRRAKREKEGK